MMNCMLGNSLTFVHLSLTSTISNNLNRSSVGPVISEVPVSAINLHPFLHRPTS